MEPEIYHLPLSIERHGSTFNDIFYLSSKYGTGDAMIDVWAYGPVQGSPPTARPSAAITPSDLPQGLLVYMENENVPKYPAVQATDRRTFGWCYVKLPVWVTARFRSFQMYVTLVLTPDPDPKGPPESKNPGASYNNPYKMLVDTGSTAIWIFSTHMPSDTRPDGVTLPQRRPVNFYNAKAEFHRPVQGEVEKGGKSFDATYVDGGSIKYKLHRDKVLLKSARILDGRKVLATKWVPLRFGAVTHAEPLSSWSDSDFDGILGLAPDSKDQRFLITFINGLIIQRDVGYPEVTIYIQAADLYENDPWSYLSISGELKFEGMPPPVWKTVPIYDDWWKIKTPAKKLNGKIFPTGSEMLTVIDTGASGIWLEDSFVVAIYKLLKDSEPVKHGPPTSRIWVLRRTARSFDALPRIEIQMGTNGDFLKLHPAAIFGEPVPDKAGFVYGTIQSVATLKRGSSNKEYLGMPALRCMWLKFNYTTEAFKDHPHDYPEQTRRTAFAWAPKTTTVIREL